MKKILFLLITLLAFSVSYSQINFGTNIRILTNLPIDTRMVMADLTERDAINSMYRFEGLTVYVRSTTKNYQLQGGISNSNWVDITASSSSSTTSYSAGTGLTLTGTTFETTAHTGDVSGTTTLTVVALQGNPVSTTTPTTGYVLKWNGTNWAPAIDATGPASSKIILLASGELLEYMYNGSNQIIYRGTVVSVDDQNNNSIEICGGSGHHDNPIGVAYKDIKKGDSGWVVIAGVTEVILSGNSQRGQHACIAHKIPGSVEARSSHGSEDIGIFMETVKYATGTFAKVMIQPN